VAILIATADQARFGPTRGAAMSGRRGRAPGGCARGSPRCSRERRRGVGATGVGARDDMSAAWRQATAVGPWLPIASPRSLECARTFHIDKATRF